LPVSFSVCEKLKITSPNRAKSVSRDLFICVLITTQKKHPAIMPALMPGYGIMTTVLT
jgi:hypothetical protein